MERLRGQAVAAAISLAFFLEAFLAPLPVASVAPPPQQIPWQQPYHFRRVVSISNPGEAALEDYPVVLTLSFSPNHLFDAADELRVFNGSGVEVPSLVLGEQVVNGSVSSASVLFPLSMPARSNATVWIYYGYLPAGLPTYRLGTSATSASSGAVSVSLGSPDSASYTIFGYAGTYSQTLEPFISYTNATGSFSSGLRLQSGWETYGGATLAGATFSAGGVTVFQAEVISGSSLVSVYQVTNEADAPVNDASISLVLNDSQLARLGPLSATYNASLGLATVLAAGAYLRFRAIPSPTSHLVASSPQIASALGLKVSQITSPESILLTWSIGSLSPGSAYTLEGTLAVSSTLGPGRLPATPPAVELGEEQASNGDFIPSVAAIWNAQVNLSNVAVSSLGVVVPLTLDNGTWLSHTLSAKGTMTYTLPSSTFSGGAGGAWSSSSSATGNATGYASLHFWSVAENGYIGRVAAFNFDNSGMADASLSSSSISLGKSSSSYLVVDYQASGTASQGDYSQQQFYAALNMYNVTTGNLVSSLYFPVSGSSTSINETASCGQNLALTPQGTSPAAKPIMGGYLIGDGAWRTLDVDLGSMLSSGGLKVQILFCSSSSAGFVGSMDLQIKSAGIRVTTFVGGLLGVSLTSNRNMTLALPSGLFGPSGEANVELSVNVEAMSNAKMNQTSGTQFTSYLPEPTISSGKEVVGVALSIYDMILYTPLSMLAPRLEVNGSAVQGLQTSDGVIYAPHGSLAHPGLIGPHAVSQMQLSFGGTSIPVDVTDEGGNPLAGALIRAQADGSGFSSANTSSSDGRASFDLVPWNYTITVSYEGSRVYNSVVNVKSGQAVQLDANVYGVTIRANDLLGRSLGAADIGISGYGFSTTLTTQDGAVSIQLPANKPYDVTVEAEGIQYFAGTVSATTQGSTIQLDTSYISSLVVLAIGAAVVAALVGVAVFLNRPFLLRTFRTSNKTRK